MSNVEISQPDAVVALPRRAIPPPQADAVITSRRRIRERLLRECEAMIQHTLGTGAEIPTELFSRYDAYLDGETNSAPESLAELAAVHVELSKLIAPATPAAVLLIQEEGEQHPFWSSLGPVPIVRHFLLLGGLSLLALLAVSLSSAVNTENLHKSLLEISGYNLLVTELFLLAAASLGSCFANLQTLRAFIMAGTYDPKHQSSYWSRWVMGVIAGILLSQVIYNVLVTAGGDGQASWMSSALSEPTLALLGGYSADLVQSTLNRIIAAIDMLLGGEPRSPTA